MSFRTFCKFLFAGLILICSAVARAQNAVNPDTVFQLDGQAQQTTNASWTCFYSPAKCDFWDLINGSGNTSTTGGVGGALGNTLPGSPAPHDSVSTFVYGGGPTLAFTGGGSKDPIDLPSWSCAATPTPNKDTLTNGYAAAYSNNDMVLTFGADRLSTSGDANIGIWFFQQGVFCDKATGHFVTTRDGSTLSQHVNNDVLIVSAFTGGGTTPQIAVYIWDTVNCGNAKHNSNPTVGTCADSNLMTKFIGNAACSTGLGTASGPITTAGGASSGACAVTNQYDIPVTWPYPSNASAPTGSYPGVTTLPAISTWTVPAQAFFNGGVDITAVIGTTPCFTSFLEDTRSSQSTSSVLKDFLGGQFPVCAMGIKKACGTGTQSDPGNGAPAPQLNSTGTSVTYSWIGSVKNTGLGTLSNINIADQFVVPQGVTAPTPTVTPATITSLAGGATASFIVTATSTRTSLENTATASATAGGVPINTTDGQGYYKTADATCMIQVPGAVTVQKYCLAPGPNLTCGTGGCVVNMPVSANVCNTGKNQLTNITLSDSPAAIFSANQLTLDGGDCTGMSAGTAKVACTSAADCTTGYTCGAAGVCVPPPNPTATYTPTSFDVNANGTPKIPFSFTDTVTVSGATATVGSSPGPSAMAGCTGQYCSTISCPLCPSGECAAP